MLVSVRAYSLCSKGLVRVAKPEDVHKLSTTQSICFDSGDGMKFH